MIQSKKLIQSVGVVVATAIGTALTAVPSAAQDAINPEGISDKVAGLSTPV